MAFALNYLSAPELLSATTSWVAIPIATGGAPAVHNPLPDLLQAHAPQAVLAVRRARDGVRDALAEADREPQGSVVDGVALDSSHDTLTKAIFYCLRSSILFTNDESKRELRTRIIKALFPNGLSITRESFAEEAGEGQVRLTRLDDDMRAELRALDGHGKNLFERVEELTEIARALGQSVEADAAAAAAASARPRGRLVSAKSKLIRAIRTLVETLALNDVDDAIIESVIGPLRIQAEAAEDRAIARAATRAAGTPATPSVGGTPAGGGTPTT